MDVKQEDLKLEIEEPFFPNVTEEGRWNDKYEDLISNTSSTDTGEEGPAVPTVSPPKKKIRKGHFGHFDAKTKERILNVYNNECFHNPDLLLSIIATRVASITGVSQRSVERIISEYKHSGGLSEPKPKPKRQTTFHSLTNRDKTVVRRKINDFYFKNEIPTVEKVLAVVNEDPDLPSFKITTFRKVLKKLNFIFAKRQRNIFLMDRDYIKCWRRDFLRKVETFRNENRKMYYLGQTSSGQTGIFPGQKNPTGKGQRLIVCHIGSEDGFVPGGIWTFQSKKNGDYHQEIDGPSFERWFAKILPMLEENAVIILDNAPYHSRKLEKIPNAASKKNIIQEWLRSKDIDFTEDMIKAQLLRLVNENKQQFNKCIIDEMAKEQNKTVLRLPPFHCDLNPIELIWTDIKNLVADKNTTNFNITDLENMFQDAISNITPEKWKTCIQHVLIKVETEMWKLDNIIEEMEIEPSTRLEENSSSLSESD